MPSGFSKKAVEGFVMFMEACYEDVLKRSQTDGMTAEEVVRDELEELRSFLESFRGRSTLDAGSQR